MIDPQSSMWQHIESELRAYLDHVKMQLESVHLSEPATAALRGEVMAIRKILAMPGKKLPHNSTPMIVTSEE
jgi:hypothetical protein